MAKRQAEGVKRQVEHLVASKVAGAAPPDETSRWLARLDTKIYKRLARVGLAAERESTAIGPFIESYIARREGVVEAGTLLVDRQTQVSLLAFFGENKALRDITEGDAEDFRIWMLTKGKKGGYAE